MKILIYTTHRTGSTSLAQLLMTHYTCDYQREGFYRNKNFIKTLNRIDNIIIKLTPSETDYESVRNYFDKCIVLIRDNKKEQAESRLYAEYVNKHFTPYEIDDSFLKEHTYELNNMEEIIQKENEILSKCENCLHITYEDLYYNNGLKKIEEYLNTSILLKLDNSKKYRDGKRKNLI
jgi:hypothetical protein